MESYILNLTVAQDEVIDWNDKVGNKLEDVTWEKIFNQNKINQEESKELFQAIDTVKMVQEGKVKLSDLGDYDPFVEILDGVVDNVVTLTYLIAMLETLGYNVNEAFNRIMENNKEKIFTDIAEAYNASNTLRIKSNIQTEVVESVVSGKSYFTLKDENGKVRKYYNFPEVDLTDLVSDVPEN